MHKLDNISIETLKEFWDTYIGERDSVESAGLNQIFLRGPFEGQSIRQVMGYAAIKLNRPKPTEYHRPKFL